MCAKLCAAIWAFAKTPYLSSILFPDGLNGVGACHSHCNGLARHGDPDRDVHLVYMGLDTQAGSNWFEPKGLRIAMAVHISYS